MGEFFALPSVQFADGIRESNCVDFKNRTKLHSITVMGAEISFRERPIETASKFNLLRN